MMTATSLLSGSGLLSNIKGGTSASSSCASGDTACFASKVRRGGGCAYSRLHDPAREQWGSASCQPGPRTARQEGANSDPPPCCPLCHPSPPPCSCLAPSSPPWPCCSWATPCSCTRSAPTRQGQAAPLAVLCWCYALYEAEQGQPCPAPRVRLLAPHPPATQPTPIHTHVACLCASALPVTPCHYVYTPRRSCGARRCGTTTSAAPWCSPSSCSWSLPWPTYWPWCGSSSNRSQTAPARWAARGACLVWGRPRWCRGASASAPGPAGRPHSCALPRPGMPSHGQPK